MTERKERIENRRWYEVTLPNQDDPFCYLFSESLNSALERVSNIRESKPPITPDIRELSKEEAGVLKEIIKSSTTMSYRIAMRKGIRGTIVRNGFPVSVGNLIRERLTKAS